MGALKLLIGVPLLYLLASSTPQAQVPFEQLHFLGKGNNAGLGPSPLIRDPKGQFYGSTQTIPAASGAGDGGGGIFRLDTNGASPQLVFRFGSVLPGATTQQRMALASDGLIYAWAHTGGSSEGGALVQVNPADGVGRILLTAAQAGTRVWELLIEGSNGRLYAIAGARLVSARRDGSELRTDFPNLSVEPHHLFELQGRLYFSDSSRVLYRATLDGTSLEAVRTFSGEAGQVGGVTALIPGVDGRIYGAGYGFSNGGTRPPPKVFSMDADGSHYEEVRSLPAFPDPNDAGLVYGNDVGSLIQRGDGVLFGSAATSGREGPGYVFRVNSDGSGFTNLFTFPPTYLAFDYGANVNRGVQKFLVEGHGGRIHGTAGNTGVGYGTAFSFEPDGTGFEETHTFHAPSDQGKLPTSALGLASDGFLYGTARQGNSGDGGTVFRIRPDGTRFQVIRNFAFRQFGAEPAGVTVGRDGRLYGVCSTAGGVDRNHFGTVFRLNRDGSEFRTLYSFSPTGGDGRQPEAPLIEGSDGVLYGTTVFGGGAASGTVFRLNSDGTGYGILHRFTNTASGAYPSARLLEGADGRLYGTAQTNGPGGHGVVFALGKDGSGFRIVHSFAATPASLRRPQGALVQGPDGMLYGTASSGGTSGFGGVFKISPDATGFRVLHAFSASGGDGRAPVAGLAFGPDGKLYGTTAFGGGAVNGSIFRLSTDGTRYEKLFAFSGENGEGANPEAELVPGPGGALFGSTRAGGPLGFGTLFRLAGATESPALGIQWSGEELELSWADADFELQQNSEVGSAETWRAVINVPPASEGERKHRVKPAEPAAFFRLFRR